MDVMFIDVIKIPIANGMTTTAENISQKKTKKNDRKMLLKPHPCPIS